MQSAASVKVGSMRTFAATRTMTAMLDLGVLGFSAFADAALLRTSGKALVATQRMSPKRSLKAVMIGVSGTVLSLHLYQMCKSWD